MWGSYRRILLWESLMLLNYSPVRLLVCYHCAVAAAPHRLHHARVINPLLVW